VADIDHLALSWRKSSASEDTDCVVVAVKRGLVMVRDSKDAGEAILALSGGDWATFMLRVRGNMPYSSPSLSQDSS
jgi:hypothetical protein